MAWGWTDGCASGVAAAGADEGKPHPCEVDRAGAFGTAGNDGRLFSRPGAEPQGLRPTNYRFPAPTTNPAITSPISLVETAFPPSPAMSAVR